MEKIKGCLVLSWERRNMKGSVVGKQGRVYIEYAQGLTNEFAKWPTYKRQLLS